MHSSSVPPPGGVGGWQTVQERGRGCRGGHPPPPHTHTQEVGRGREPGASGHRPTTSVAGGQTGQAGQTDAAGLTGPSHCPSSPEAQVDALQAVLGDAGQSPFP